MLYVSGAVHHRMCERIYNITWKQQTLNQKKKSTFCVLFFIFCTYKPNSVLLRATVIYLGCLLPSTSSDSPGKPGTILHSRKDLAVSLFNFNIYEDLSDCSDTIAFRLLASLLAPLPLPTTGVTRYASARRARKFKVHKVIRL